MPQNQGQNPQNRAAVYVDGFNLYHPIHEMGEPFLKWIDLWRLSEAMCQPQNLALVKVAFCTAVPAHLPDKRDRHNTYNNVLASKGVTIVKGHHVFDPAAKKYTEKQSDINVALSLILDGLDDIYDWAFLVTADSDQAATARHFSERLGHKKLVCVAPPNKEVPHKSLPYSHTHFVLTKQMIETCVMPAIVQTPKGSLIRRPAQYTPPDGWVHPDNRPAKK